MNRAIKAALLVIVAVALFMPACGEKAHDDAEVIFELLAPEDLQDIPFPDDLSREDRNYLKIESEGPVTLQDLGTDVLVLKFLNVHCPACQQQAPIINEAYRAVEDRKDLRERVKFLAVAAGNNAMETEKFKEEFKVPFPVVPDPLFHSYDAVGNPGGLPFMLIITIHPQGGGTAVAKGHAGIVESSSQLVREAESGLTAKAHDWDKRLEDLHLGEWKNLEMSVSESYLFKLLKKSAGEVDLQIEEITPFEIAEKDIVYRMDTSEGQTVWAKVAGRAAICNICHNIFFIILFDEAGDVINYTSIRVTKVNNLIWDDEDNVFMKKRIIGRSLLKNIVFDPDVDAVTTATMSSALIFDTVRRLGGTFDLMKKQGMLGEKSRIMNYSESTAN